MQNDFDTTLNAICDGLLYPSEADAPIVPFRWKRGKQSARQAAVARCEQKSPVEAVAFDDFFEPLLRASDGVRFGRLKSLLHERLTGLTVVRIGSPRVTIYVIGRTGVDWAGVSTVSVET